MASRMRRLSCNGSIQSTFKILQTKPATKTEEVKLVKRPIQYKARREVEVVEVVHAFQPILWLCRSSTDTIRSVVSMSHGLVS